MKAIFCFLTIAGIAHGFHNGAPNCALQSPEGHGVAAQEERDFGAILNVESLGNNLYEVSIERDEPIMGIMLRATVSGKDNESGGNFVDPQGADFQVKSTGKLSCITHKNNNIKNADGARLSFQFKSTSGEVPIFDVIVVESFAVWYKSNNFLNLF